MMKNLFLSTVLTMTTATTYASTCSYNFDANQSEITSAFGSGLLLFPSINGQKTSFDITPTSTDHISYAASSKDFATTNNPDINVPATGIFAFEYKVKVPTYLLPSEEQLMSWILPAGYNNSEMALHLMITINNNIHANPNVNTLDIYVNDSGTPLNSTPITNTSDGYQTVGVYINQSTNKIAFIINGVDTGYMAELPNAIESMAFPHLSGFYGIQTSSPTIGTNVSIELITDHDQMHFSYPVGTTDICGNAI